MHVPELSVILPVYNAQHFILKSVREKLDLLYKLEGELSFELIVVADGDFSSLKNTLSELSDPHLIITGYDIHKGKGHAVRHGWKIAKGIFISYVDADFDIDFGVIQSMLNTAKNTGADIIYANKYHKNSHLSTRFSRRTMSILYTSLISLLFQINVKDTQTGAKLYKNEVIKKILPKCSIDGFGFEIETFIEAKRAGHIHFEEVPVTIKKSGQSKKSLDMVLGIIMDTYKVLFR